MTDAVEAAAPARRPGRGDPPAQSAKVISAGLTGSALLGLVALLGWADQPAPSPSPTSVSEQPVGTVVTTAPAVATSGLVPLATTLASATTLSTALAPTTLLPATPPPPTLAPVPPSSSEPAPSQAVSEQSR